MRSVETMLRETSMPRTVHTHSLFHLVGRNEIISVTQDLPGKESIFRNDLFLSYLNPLTEKAATEGFANFLFHYTCEDKLLSSVDRQLSD